MTMGSEQSVPRDDADSDNQSVRSSELPRWDHPDNQEESERQAATQPLPQTEPFSDPPPVEAASPPATTSKKKKKKRDRGSLGAAMDSPGRSLSQPTPLKRKKTTRPSLGNDENGVLSPDGSARRKLKKTKRMSLAAILNDNDDNANTNDSQDSFVSPPTLPELRAEPQTQNDEEEDDLEVATASQRRKSSGKKKKSKKSEPAPEPEVSPEPPAADDHMELDEPEENLANLKAERPDNNSDDDIDMEDGPPTQSQQLSKTAAPQNEGEETPPSPPVLIKSEPGVYDDNDDDEVDASRIELEDAADEDDDSPAQAKSERTREVMDESASAHDSGYVETSGSDERSRRGLSQVSHALDHDEATPSEDEAMQLVKSAPEGDDDEEMDGTPESEASPSQALKAVPESDNEVEGTPESEAEEDLVHKAERESDVEEEQVHKAERESDVEQESEVDDEERINDPLESEEEDEPEAIADEEEAGEEEDQEQQAVEERASEIPESEPEQPPVHPEYEAAQHEESRFEPISDAETEPATQNGQASANETTARSSPDLGGNDVEAVGPPSLSPPPPSSVRARWSTKRKAKPAFNPDATHSELPAQPEESPVRPQKKQKPKAQAEEKEEQEEEEGEAASAPTPAPKKKRAKKTREVSQDQQEDGAEEASVPNPAPKKKKTKKIREMLQEQRDGEEAEEEATVPTPAPKKKRTRKIRETLQQQQDGEDEEEVPDASTPAPKKKAKAKKSKNVAADEEEQTVDKNGYATGRLTAVEEDKVTRAVNKFRRDEGLTQEEINKIIHENPAAAAFAARGAPTLHGPLWSAVCEACPSRTRLKLQKFCRRKFNNYVARGQWTAEQDEELQQMMKIHGTKWTHIGGLINRHPQDVRDRWRDYLVCQDKVVKNEWSREEEEQLTKAVNEAIDKIRKDLISRREDEGQAEGLINWQGISEAMGRTRNRLQCMEKWKRILKAEPVADRDKVVTLLPDTDTWRVKLARQDLTKITSAEKYRLARTIRDGCAEIEKEIDWRKITERIFKNKYQRLALVVIWGRLRSSVPNHADKTVHECAQHIVDMYDKDAGFGDSYGDYPDERAVPSSAMKPPASAKKPKADSKSRRSSARSTSAPNGKKKELSAAIIVDESDSEPEAQPEEDTVMNDATSVASDAPPVDPDEEVEEEEPEEPEEEEAEVADEEEHEEPPQSSVVKRLAPTEEDTDEDDDTRPPFMPSPSVEAEASRTRRRERSLSAKPPTPGPIDEESGEEVQDEDMVTTTRLKSAKKRPAASAEEISPRKKKRKTSEGTTRPVVLSSSSPAVTYGRKSSTRKEIKKAAAEAVKARQARALSTISSDMDDMDDIPAKLPGQTPPRPTPAAGRTMRRAARQ